jgi:hypothetical protein
MGQEDKGTLYREPPSGAESNVYRRGEGARHLVSQRLPNPRREFTPTPVRGSTATPRRHGAETLSFPPL